MRNELAYIIYSFPRLRSPHALVCSQKIETERASFFPETVVGNMTLHLVLPLFFFLYLLFSVFWISIPKSKPELQRLLVWLLGTRGIMGNATGDEMTAGLNLLPSPIWPWVPLFQLLHRGSSGYINDARIGHIAAEMVLSQNFCLWECQYFETCV